MVPNGLQDSLVLHAEFALCNLRAQGAVDELGGQEHNVVKRNAQTPAESHLLILAEILGAVVEQSRPARLHTVDTVLPGERVRCGDHQAGVKEPLGLEHCAQFLPRRFKIHAAVPV